LTHAQGDMTSADRRVVVAEVATLAARLAEHVAGEVTAALEARGRCVVLLTGGSLAPTFFPALAALPLDWRAVDFVWGDERAVPPDAAESNYRAARELWLDPARVPEERRHRMPAERADLESAAAAYSAELAAVAGGGAGGPLAVDVALLGVGPDGHVCSLFPGHPALDEAARWVLAVHDSPKPPPRRLTVTLSVLAAARSTVVAALGEGKAAAIAAALEDPASPLPIALVARRARRALFLLDPAAASALEG
jgi:6-phosphogluconolactonase